MQFNLGDDAKLSKRPFEDTEQFKTVKAYYGGKLMSFGCEELYENAAAFIMTKKTLGESMTALYGCMIVANSPGLFLATGRTKAGKGDGVALAADVLSKVPQLDKIKHAEEIALRKAKGWGDWAVVNNRLCCLIWHAACHGFAGKDVSHKIDTWVAKNGSISSIGSKTLATRAERDADKSNKTWTEAIKIEHAQLITKFPDQANNLIIILSKHIVGIEVSGSTEPVNYMTYKAMQRQSKAKRGPRQTSTGKQGSGKGKQTEGTSESDD